MIDLLQQASLEVLGRHPYASNQVFIVACHGETTVRAIYKPVAGERPLWDFPRGELARREVASYALSEQLGLGLVPATVWREDGPFGPGSLQIWIEDASLSDVDIVQQPQAGWCAVLDAQLEDGSDVTVVHRDLPELRALALFDAVLNNGDRKAGHMLRDAQGTLWAVDHGVTFHTDPKLRTVLWGFRGDRVDVALLDRLSALDTRLPELRRALDDDELEALQQRVDGLRRSGIYPDPPQQWPAIPWPIY
ncbi:MAG: SCO1664 family protein [Candidatus Nanopelagicales bacterium]